VEATRLKLNVDTGPLALLITSLFAARVYEMSITGHELPASVAKCRWLPSCVTSDDTDCLSLICSLLYRIGTGLYPVSAKFMTMLVNRVLRHFMPTKWRSYRDHRSYDVTSFNLIWQRRVAGSGDRRMVT